MGIRGRGAAVIRRALDVWLMVMVTAVVVIWVVPSSYARATETSYEVPQKATQVWIDVEYSGVKGVDVSGTFAGENVTFASSPNGKTAVVDSDVKGLGSATVAVKATKDIHALVAVTFADSDDVILSEYSTRTELGAKPTTVVPQNQVTPSAVSGSSSSTSGSSAITSTGRSISGVLGATGASVVALLAFAALAVFVGLRLKGTALASASRGAHARGNVADHGEEARR